MYHPRPRVVSGFRTDLCKRFLVSSLHYDPIQLLLSIPKLLFATTSHLSPSYRILFLGSDTFSIKSLDAVTNVFPPPSQIQVVVSNLNNPLAKYVQSQKPELNWLQLRLWDQFKSDVEPGTVRFDLGVVSSFGHLVPSKVINHCKMGILNVHGSLLPRWRGAAPTAAAIINGDTISGVSIMKIAPHRFDIGPILYQTSVPLDPHIRTPELTSLLSTVGAAALEKVLCNHGTYLKVALPQDESMATTAPKLTDDLGLVQWESMNALEIYNVFRGIHGRFKLKTLFCQWTVDLDDLAVLDDTQTPSKYLHHYGYSPKVSTLPKILPHTNALPGDIVFSDSDNLLCVKCHPDPVTPQDPRLHWIFVRKVKINQRWMTARDFKNGWLFKADETSRRFETLTSYNKSKSSSKTT